MDMVDFIRYVAWLICQVLLILQEPLLRLLGI